MPRVAFHTLGCKLNFAETSTIAQDFRSNGFEEVSFKDAADVYVINTCSVTENADRECRNIVGRGFASKSRRLCSYCGMLCSIEAQTNHGNARRRLSLRSN